MKRALIIYGASVVALALWIALRPDNQPKVETMTREESKDGVKVPAMPTGIWTWVFDYVKGPAQILIEAKGSWSYSSGEPCGPDGDLKAFIPPDSTIFPAAPWGALLVKVGGSTAGVSDGSVHVAGSQCLVVIDEKVSGPVFLTINDEVSGFHDNSGSLEVKISIRH